MTLLLSNIFHGKKIIKIDSYIKPIYIYIDTKPTLILIPCTFIISMHLFPLFII